MDVPTAEPQTGRAMPPMSFTAEEYRDAAQACRALAAQHERDAANQQNPSIVKLFNDQAKRFRELAQKFDLAAKWL